MKRLLILMLSVAMIIPSIFTVHAEENQYGIILDTLQYNDNTIEYTEVNEEGTFHVVETLDDSAVNSYIYRENGDSMELSLTIKRVILGNTIYCTEIDSDGQQTEYTLHVEVNDSLTGMENLAPINQPNYGSTDELFLRTEQYSVSFVGKKTTVAAVVAVLIAACKYLPSSLGTTVITAALTIIGGGVAAAVSQLPNYMYVTSNIYQKTTNGKIYKHYYNDYYLDSGRTQFVKHTFHTHRIGH